LFKNHSSSILDVNCGVPQGSILGPLLFLLYINDIESSSKLLRFLLFADDTNLFLSANSLSELISALNCELNCLSDWFRANLLSINIQKTKYILFGAKQKLRCAPPFNLAIDGISLDRVTFTKFLGVYIDEDLNWKPHTSYISLKISKSLGVINRVKSILPCDLLLSLYYTLIHPYLLFCNIIWGGASKLALHRLVCLQKRAMRILTHSHYLASSTPLFLHLKILKISDLYRYYICLFMYRAKNNLLPVSCSHHTRFVNRTPRYPMRNTNDFELMPFCTNLRRKYIGIVGPEIWHSLPLSLKTLNSEYSFKKSLFELLLEEYV